MYKVVYARFHHISYAICRISYFIWHMKYEIRHMACR
jgi:hypothetical protein